MRYEYAELGNMFWEKHNSVLFKASEIALYFFLVHHCNKGRWTNPFQLTAQQLRFSGLSEDTIIAAKRTLKNSGLIDFETKKGSKFTSFELSNLPKKSATSEATSAKPPANLPPNLPEKKAGFEITPYIHENIIQTQKKVCAFFGFGEVSQHQNWKQVYQFLECLVKQDKLDYFNDQFLAYQEYKRVAQEKEHMFKTFIGNSSENYEDGAWNAENWQNKLKNLKKKSVPELAYAGSVNGKMARMHDPNNKD
jgi:hypothetical protein